ncbi:MAG: hypothetical protein ABEJ06_04370 [Haloarculaceae archaeon]
MTDDVRVWLVERSYNSRDLITLVYATPDGERALTQERSSSMVMRGTETTAGMAVSPDRLEPVDDPDLRGRYAAEAERMADRHDPADPV